MCFFYLFLCIFQNMFYNFVFSKFEILCFYFFSRFRFWDFLFVNDKGLDFHIVWYNDSNWEDSRESVRDLFIGKYFVVVYVIQILFINLRQGRVNRDVVLEDMIIAACVCYIYLCSDDDVTYDDIHRQLIYHIDQNECQCNASIVLTMVDVKVRRYAQVISFFFVFFFWVRECDNLKIIENLKKSENRIFSLKISNIS